MKSEYVVNDKKVTIYCYEWHYEWHCCILLFTVRKRSCGNVMFSQACVKNSVPRQTATAADGTHPTGMHSCSSSKMGQVKWSDKQVMVHLYWTKPTQRPIPIPWNSIVSGSRQCDHCYRVPYRHYRPQRSYGKVNFLHMSVILFIGGSGRQTPRADTPTPRQTDAPLLAGRHPLLAGRHTPGKQTPPTPRDGHCNGRYASYWNAFLFTSWSWCLTRSPSV